MKYLLFFVFFTFCFISFSQNKTETKTVSYDGYVHGLIYNEYFAWLLIYERNNSSSNKYFKKINILKFDLEQNSFLKKEEIKVSNFTEKGERLYNIILIDDKFFGLFGKKKNEDFYEFYLRHIDFEREKISAEKSEVVAKMDHFARMNDKQLKITSSSNDVYYGFYSNISNTKTVNHQVNIYNSETKEWKRKHFKTNTKAAIYPKIFVLSNNGSFLIAANENQPGSYSSSTTFAYCFNDEINIKEFKYEKIKTAVVTAEASENNIFLIKIVANGFNKILFEYWRHITPENFGDRKLFREEKIELDGYGALSHHNKSIFMSRANYPYLYPCDDGSFFMIEETSNVLQRKR